MKGTRTGIREGSRRVLRRGSGRGPDRVLRKGSERDRGGD